MSERAPLPFDRVPDVDEDVEVAPGVVKRFGDLTRDELADALEYAMRTRAQPNGDGFEGNRPAAE